MIKGVSDSQLKIIKNILHPYSGEFEFFLYGSRVDGDFQTNSDLDVLIKGNQKLSFEDMENIKKQFDSSSLPFIVHIADFHDIDKSFYEILKNNMIKI